MIDVLIIGAGFAGASVAYHLSKRPGLKIQLVEKEDTFGVHASGRNAAMLRQGVSDFQTGKWIQETRGFLLDPPGHWDCPHLFRPTGSLLLGKKDHLASLHAQIFRLGSSAEHYDSKKFPSVFPKVLREFLEGCPYESLLFTPGDGVVDIHALLGHLLKDASHQGVVLNYGREVEALHRTGQFWNVESSPDGWKTKVVINATGAWVNLLGRKAGLQGRDLISYRRHLYFTQTPVPMDSSWPLIWNLDKEVYFRPETGGLLLSPGDEEPYPPGIPSTDPQALELLHKKLATAFPHLKTLRVVRAWACLRTKGPFEKMYIRQDPEKPSFFWAGGLGGHGVAASIGLGRAVSTLVRKYLGI